MLGVKQVEIELKLTKEELDFIKSVLRKQKYSKDYGKNHKMIVDLLVKFKHFEMQSIDKERETL